MEHQGPAYSSLSLTRGRFTHHLLCGQQAAPLEFLHIITELSDYDKTCLVESRMVLPRFRGILEGWTYDEDFKDNDTTTSIMLLEHRNLGRLSMGASAPAPSRSDSTSTTSWPSGISPCPAPSSSTPPAARK